MTENAKGRMLLSHNFTLDEDSVHPLTREEFAAVFSQGLNQKSGIHCALIDNPHWVVEVNYDASTYKPTAVGQLCAEALAQFRKNSQAAGFTVMALGGVKTTPATSPPPSLQTGEWGVDVVETLTPDEFLEEINWKMLAGAKPAEAVFRIDCTV